jgi:hypothetical protein
MVVTHLTLFFVPEAFSNKKGIAFQEHQRFPGYSSFF